jgi:hypothetical protein
MNLLTVLQDRVCDSIHLDPKRATYETSGATEDRFGYQQRAVGYCNHSKTWTQDDCEPIQKDATAIGQPTHRASPALHENHFRRELGKAVVDQRLPVARTV